jgi:opacity protein-like surface antigen
LFRKIKITLLFLYAIPSFSQTQDEGIKYFDASKKFSLYLYGTYVSASELQNDPKSSNPIERDATVDLDGGYGYGGEFMFDPGIYNLGIRFYLSSEYLKIDQTDLELVFNNGSTEAKVPMREKFTFIPVEFGVKWNLPVGSDNLKIYIGGGGGVYFGNRTRFLQDMQSTTLYKKPGFSLNILSGLEYFIARNLSADLELKFREASFDVESGFDRNQIEINGIQFQLTNPFYSRIIVDGVRVSLGFKYHF